jgi:membrane-associated phospholipid phosphatase
MNVEVRGRTLLAILPLWVGISRINVGAHFPADVLAGYFCGASGLLANKAAESRLKGYRCSLSVIRRRTRI